MVLLYDQERDGDIRPGEAILVFEDGTTRRVRESSLYLKEEANVRESAEVQRPGVIRSRATREVKHRDRHTRQTSPRKRLALYTA